MWVWTVRWAQRTRWLVLSSWCALWLFGNSALTLTRHGYSYHSWTWWLLSPAASAAFGLFVSWSAVSRAKQIVATQREAIAGLDRKQCRQVARAWKRGPIPEDPAVLTAVLRFHDLSEHYRRRSLSRRIVLVALMFLNLPAAISTYVTHRQSGVVVMMVAFWVIIVLAMFWPDARTVPRKSRLVQLKTAAAQDPSVSAAVADCITPAPRPKWSAKVMALIVAVTVAYVGTLIAALYFSPKERGCRAARAMIHELYSDRDWFWTTNIGPSGRPLADYQAVAERLRHYASDANGQPTIAPHTARIVELVDQAVMLVSQARQPTTATDPDPVPDTQSRYADLLNSIADEETPVISACR